MDEKTHLSNRYKSARAFLVDGFLYRTIFVKKAFAQRNTLLIGPLLYLYSSNFESSSFCLMNRKELFCHRRWNTIVDEIDCYSIAKNSSTITIATSGYSKGCPYFPVRLRVQCLAP